MLTGREAQVGDQEALDAFVCAPPQGQSYARDVQQWVSGVLDWRGEGEGRHVRLYSDDSGLVAVLAWRHLIDGEPGTGFFIYLLAVRHDRKREGIAAAILNGLKDHLAAIEPGATLAWMVDPKNSASVAMSMLACDDAPRSDHEWPHYLEFTATLPTPGETAEEHSPLSE